MMKRGISGAIVFAVLLFCNIRLYAQYNDHRNRQVDSLEQVLTTKTLTEAELANIYFNLMGGYSQINIEKSMEYARKSVDIAAKMNRLSGLTVSYRMLGQSHYTVSRYDSALYYYDKALETISRMADDSRYNERNIDEVSSSVYGSIGNVHNIQGNYHEAVEYYIKALAIFEKYGWIESTLFAYGNIGEMYQSMDNREQAEINFLKADSLAYVTGDSLMIATAKWHLGNLYVSAKDYGKALENAEIAYGYYFSHPEEGGDKATTLNLLAIIYLNGYDNAGQAEEYARRALALANEIDIPREKSVSLRILSSICMKRGEWRTAGQTALDALAADDTEPANTLSLYAILAKAYAYQGNAVKSAEYFDKHNALQSSWSGKHYQSAIRDMEVKYETEKKEMRISALEDEKQMIENEKRLIVWLSIAVGGVLLLALAALFFLWRWSVLKKRATEERMEQEKRIVATQALLDGEVQERTRLARDLHDGLGSMLTGTKMNMEELKNDALQGKVDMERFDSTLKIINDSSHELRRVAHHLMPDSLSRFGLKTSVSDFCNTIPVASFSWYGDDMRLEPKLEVMIYRTIHELVNNALKHARASQILVQIIQEPGRIAFTVQDDGCGFDPSAVSGGMGLANIRTRVASFGGIMNIVSTADEGTEINVELRTFSSAKPMES